MKRPLLQLALDELSLDHAFEVLSTGVDEVVDIIECGTVLIGSEGRKVVGIMRDRYPNKKLVADFKIAVVGDVRVAADRSVDRSSCNFLLHDVLPF